MKTKHIQLKYPELEPLFDKTLSVLRACKTQDELKSSFMNLFEDLLKNHNLAGLGLEKHKQVVSHANRVFLKQKHKILNGAA